MRAPRRGDGAGQARHLRPSIHSVSASEPRPSAASIAALYPRIAWSLDITSRLDANPVGCGVDLVKVHGANELLKHGDVRVVCRVQSKAVRVGFKQSGVVRPARGNWSEAEKARIVVESADAEANISEAARRNGVSRSLLKCIAKTGAPPGEAHA
jgi:hypothetical protein